MGRNMFNDNRPSFWQAIPQLLGHLIGGAIIFISVALLAWLLGWSVSKLNAIQPFSPSILSAFEGIELALLYLDIGLSGIVMGVGTYRFVKEII